MNRREQSGQTLVVAIALMAVVVVIGVGVYLICAFFGGARESQNSVDAASLNMTKEVAKNVGVTLQPGVEQENFSALVDQGTGRVNLLTYNRLVGQALLVAANAQKEGTPQARRNAQQLFRAIQSGPNSVGQRLAQELSNPHGPASRYFAEMAGKNSIRMLGGSAALAFSNNKFAVAYSNRYIDGDSARQDAASNVSIDLKKNPEMSQFATNIPDPNNPGTVFLKGYYDISLPGIGTITGITNNPGQSPRLISSAVFNKERTSPTQQGVVPPNSFISSATTSGQSQIANLAAATVGCKTTFEASIPAGFVKISNLPGIPYRGIANVTTSTALNYELFDGLYLVDLAPVPGEPARLGFSADSKLLSKWISYNQQQLAQGKNSWEETDFPVVEGQLLTGQSNAPDSPQSTIFNYQGQPASRQELGRIIGFHGGTGTDGQPRKDTYLDLDLDNGSPELIGLYDSGAIETAHQFDFQIENPGSIQPAKLIAIEKVKSLILDKYFASMVLQPNGRPVSISSVPKTVNTNNIGPTGMRKFDRNATIITLPEGSGDKGLYPGLAKDQISTGTIQFSEAGTPCEYLEQIARDNPNQAAVHKLKEKMFERLRQIQPGAQDAELEALLNAVQLDLGQTAFIYKDQKSGQLTVKKSDDAGLPAWMKAMAGRAVADGQKETASTPAYNVLGNIVNPFHEIGLHGYPFAAVNHLAFYDRLSDTHLRDQTSVAALNGQDSVEWTAGSGYGNDLGELVFKNSSQGTVVFSIPN